MNIGISELLETIDCDLFAIGNIHRFKDLDEVLNVINTHTDDEEDKDIFEEQKENNTTGVMYFLVDIQMNRLRGIFNTVNIPLIVENVSTFIDDTYYEGIVNSSVNQTGKNIDLPDRQYTTLLEHLDNNNENNRLCSEYMHESIRAIVNPDRFVNDVSNNFLMYSNDRVLVVETTHYDDRLYRVCIEDDTDKTVVLIDCNYDMQEVIDCDIDNDTVQEVIDFMRDSKYISNFLK